jgi:hypothetical protein
MKFDEADLNALLAPLEALTEAFPTSFGADEAASRRWGHTGLL